MNINATLTTQWGDGSTLIQNCKVNTDTQEIHSVEPSASAHNHRTPPVQHLIDINGAKELTVWTAREYRAGIPTGEAWIDEEKEPNFIR